MTTLNKTTPAWTKKLNEKGGLDGHEAILEAGAKVKILQEKDYGRNGFRILVSKKINGQITLKSGEIINYDELFSWVDKKDLSNDKVQGD